MEAIKALRGFAKTLHKEHQEKVKNSCFSLFVPRTKLDKAQGLETLAKKLENLIGMFELDQSYTGWQKNVKDALNDKKLTAGFLSHRTEYLLRNILANDTVNDTNKPRDPKAINEKSSLLQRTNN